MAPNIRRRPGDRPPLGTDLSNDKWCRSFMPILVGWECIGVGMASDGKYLSHEFMGQKANVM